MPFPEGGTISIALRLREIASDNATAAEVFNDATLLRKMIQELADFLGKPNGPNIGADQLQQYLRSGAAKALIATVTERMAEEGAEAGEMAAAYAIYYECPSVEFGKVLFLEDLLVRPLFRRQKVGAKMMRSIVDISRDLRCDSLLWHVRSFNSDAIRFYRQIGAEELTAKSADGRPKVNCWGIGAAQFDGVISSSKDFGEANFHLLNGAQLKEGAAHIAENWRQMDENQTEPPAEKEHFERALQMHGFEAIIAQNPSSRSVLGLALFHRCAFSTWHGPYIAIDCLKVRWDCRRRGIGRQLAVEICRIALETNSPNITWVAREDKTAEALFRSIGAINLTDEENCLMFMLKGE